MLSRLRQRLTYANVMATIGVFLGLGGTAWAVAANSVGTAQLKNGAVTNPKLAANSIGTGKVIDGSLLKQDFKAGQVPAATNIVVRRRDVVPGPYPISVLSVGCNAGEKLVGGGVVRVNHNGGYVVRSQDAVAMSAPVQSEDVLSVDGETPTKWLSAFLYTQSSEAGERIRHYAICARP
jgi:hypothetical protein